MTRDLQGLNLLPKLMVLHCHTLFILAIAAIAEAILGLTSAEQVPSLHRVAPRYLKLVTASNCLSFIYTDVFCAVGHYLALFCADFHSKCSYSVFKSVGEVLSSPLLLPIRLMLLAKHRLHMGLTPIEMGM